MLDWLYTAISFVLKTWHSLYSTFLDPDSGLTWTLSIVFLVVTVRIIIFPLFVKQVRSQRAMQLLQPEIAKLKEKYGKDRQGFSQAMMALQRERGVNPLAGCLPILLQAPIFIALLHVLRRLHPDAQGLYSWDDALTRSAAVADVFGAPISSSFTMSGARLTELVELGASETSIKVVTLTLMILMSITTFVSQKMIMAKSGPVEGQAATIQKFLLYVMPIGLFIGGFIFPLGVLIYWFVNNLWSMGQQYYILHKMPPPGSKLALKKAEAEGTLTPKVDPKTLAPKPGAKPTQPKNRRPAASTGQRSATEQGGSKTGAQGSKPRAGQKPTAGSKSGGKPGSPRSGPNGRPVSDKSEASTGSTSNGSGSSGGKAGSTSGSSSGGSGSGGPRKQVRKKRR